MVPFVRSIERQNMSFDISSLFKVSETDQATIVMDRYAEQLPGVIHMGLPYYAIDLSKRVGKSYIELTEEIRENFIIEKEMSTLGAGVTALNPADPGAVHTHTIMSAYIKGLTPPEVGTYWLVAAILGDPGFDYRKAGNMRPEHEFAVTVVHVHEDQVLDFFGVN